VRGVRNGNWGFRSWAAAVAIKSAKFAGKWPFAFEVQTNRCRWKSQIGEEGVLFVEEKTIDRMTRAEGVRRDFGRPSKLVRARPGSKTWARG
jgi:hypothetical protein